MPIFKKILKSQRGGKILIDQEGYLYNYLRETGKGSTWACRAKYKLNCYTRVYYCENSTSDHVEITVEHNHPPKLGEAKTIELMRKLKTGAKNSYKMRRDLLKQLKYQDDIDLEQDLPTLLNNRKTRKRRSKISSSVSVELETEEQQENLIVDVDSYGPDILSTTDTQQEHSAMESEVTRINQDLQDALQKLMSDPDLLQDLVNTLMEPCKVNTAEAEQDTKTPENEDLKPSTTADEERILTPSQQQGESQIPAHQQEESLIPAPFSGALTTRQTSVWTPPTYNTQPQLIRLVATDTDSPPASTTIVTSSSSDSTNEKCNTPQSQPVNCFSENLPKVNLNSDKLHCSTVSTSATPHISRITTTASPDIAMATLTLPQIAMTSSGHPQIAMTSPGPQQIAMTSQGPQQIALTSPGIQQIAMTSPGPQQIAMTSQGPQQIAMTSQGPPQIAMTSPGPPQIAMTSPGLQQIAMTSPVPQIVATVPVPSTKIVATVGQSSDNTLVAGQLVRLPETIISNDMLLKRMNDGGCTVYIAPPALKNPYCRQCKTSFSTSEQLDEHFNSLKCCEMCKMAFCVPEHYEKHVELNHPDGNKSAWGTLCETCGRVFGVMFQLDSHRIKCSNRVSLRCPRCFYSFGFEGDLIRHKLLHGNVVDVKCNSFVTENQFRRSSSVKVPQYYQTCTKKSYLECQNGTDTNFRPIGTTNSQAEKVCHFCTKAFPNQQKLLAHQSQHLDINICKFCGISCQNQMELVEHERTNHMFNNNINRNKT